jgi:hypothetical protein
MSFNLAAAFISSKSIQSMGLVNVRQPADDFVAALFIFADSLALQQVAVVSANEVIIPPPNAQRARSMLDQLKYAFQPPPGRAQRIAAEEFSFHAFYDYSFSRLVMNLA